MVKLFICCKKHTSEPNIGLPRVFFFFFFLHPDSRFTRKVNSVMKQFGRLIYPEQCGIGFCDSSFINREINRALTAACGNARIVTSAIGRIVRKDKGETHFLRPRDSFLHAAPFNHFAIAHLIHNLVVDCVTDCHGMR